MDGRGRALDNVFVERLWRSVKYEEVYLQDYADGWEAEASLARVLPTSTATRGIHQALGLPHAGRGVPRSGLDDAPVRPDESTTSRAKQVQRSNVTHSGDANTAAARDP